MRQITNTFTIASPAEDVRRRLPLKRQFLAFEVNLSLFYYPLTVNVPPLLCETNWGLASVRRAYKSLAQVIVRQGFDIEHRVLSRMDYHSRMRNIFKPGAGRWHVHALLSRELKLSASALDDLKRKLLKTLKTENKKAIDISPLRSLKHWVKYLEKNIQRTEKPKGVRVKMLTFKRQMKAAPEVKTANSSQQKGLTEGVNAADAGLTPPGGGARPAV